LHHDERFDLSPSTAGSLAYMAIHEAPLESVTPRRVRGIISLLNVNLEIFPDQPSAHRALVAAHLRANQPEIARSFLLRALDLDPNDPLTAAMAADLEDSPHE